MIKHDESKLPKWVQQELKRLRFQRDNLEFVVVGGYATLPSNLTVEYDLVGDGDIHMNQGDSISFNRAAIENFMAIALNVGATRTESKGRLVPK